MIDLEALERKIDAALARETPESLTAWLMNKRASDVDTYIGEGDYVPYNFNFLEEIDHLINMEKQAENICDKNIYTNAGNTAYAMAA